MIEIPITCPSCNSELERVNDQLFCRNSECSEKNKKVVRNYAAKTKIKGLGEKTIEKLGISTIQDIYNLEEEFVVNRIGSALGVKLMREIENAKHLDLGTFLSACSIYLIGSSAGKKLEALTYKLENIDKNLCKEASLGDKASNSLLTWLNDVYPTMDLPIVFNEVKVSNNSNKPFIKVCITGKLNNYTKAKATEVLNTYDIEVVNTVNKNIQYLICDTKKNSAKEKKAEELKIDIITFDKLMEKIKNDR